MRSSPEHRVGRRRSTTRDHFSNVAIDLFAARGFDDGQRRRRRAAPRASPAAPFSATTRPRTPCPGAISTPTSTTCAICWRDLDPTVPIGDALRTALLAFNTFDEAETPRHRQRMRVILETAELQAYSMTMYAGWRAVVAAFVARRLGVKASDLVPQTVAWTMLGVAPCRPTSTGWPTRSVSLAEALGDAFDTVSDGLAALDLNGPAEKNSRFGRRSSAPRRRR